MTVDKTFVSGDVVEYSILKFTGEVTKVHFKKDGSIDLLEVCVLRSDNHKIFQHSKEFISSKNFGKDYKNIKIVPSDTSELNYKDHEEVDKLLKIFTERAISREREFKIDVALKNRDRELFDRLTGEGQK
jgi:hypothetical protein